MAALKVDAGVVGDAGVMVKREVVEREIVVEPVEVARREVDADDVRALGDERDAEGARVTEEVEPPAAGLCEGSDACAVVALVREEAHVDAFPGFKPEAKASFVTDEALVTSQEPCLTADEPGLGQLGAAKISEVLDLEDGRAGVKVEDIVVDALFEGEARGAAEGGAEHGADAVEIEAGEAICLAVDQAKEVGLAQGAEQLAAP